MHSRFQPQRSPLSHTLIVVLLLGAHLGLGWLLLRGSLISALVQPAPLLVTVVPQTRAAMPLAVAQPTLVHLTAPTIPPPEVSLPSDTAPIAAAAVSAPTPAAVVSAAPTISQPPAGDTPALMSEIAYLRQPAPHYPTVSRHAREEGLVILRVTIDEVGRVETVAVYRSSGHPRLDEAAKDAVALALFKPFVSGGIARAAIAMIPIEFSLRSAAS
jgi:protein TonB